MKAITGPQIKKILESCPDLTVAIDTAKNKLGLKLRTVYEKDFISFYDIESGNTKVISIIISLNRMTRKIHVRLCY